MEHTRFSIQGFSLLEVLLSLLLITTVSVNLLQNQFHQSKLLNLTLKRVSSLIVLNNRLESLNKFTQPQDMFFATNANSKLSN